jgi:hypothetical protein
MLIDSETSRLRSLLVNSGRFSFPEADRRLTQSSLALAADRDILSTAAAQAALLTAVAAGVRTFGEIAVPPNLDIAVKTPLPIPGNSLCEQLRVLGACERVPKPGERLLVIGSSEYERDYSALRAVWSGWIAGIQPGGHPIPAGSTHCVLAAAAAGALGIAESFAVEYGNVRAGRRVQQLSLWSPGTYEESVGPDEFALPLSEWVVGIGNLGQAHLWCLALLPYPKPEDVALLLQDFDYVKAENWGTSLLVQRGRYGMLKTRLAEKWCAARGFRVRRIDRRLDEYLRRQEDEPVLAVAGLDRLPPRRLLGHVGFDHIVDVGLGADADTYHQFRLTVFDRNYSPAKHFGQVRDQDSRERTQHLAAYQSLLSGGLVDACGMASLAGIPVAVPFVSLIASAVALAQVIRLASGAAPAVSLTASVDSLASCRATSGLALVRPTFPVVHGARWAQTVTQQRAKTEPAVD